MGRTARAGQAGYAISFCSESERDFLRSIERFTRKDIPVVHDSQFHSQAAQDASGSAAKPPPRGRFGGRRSGFRHSQKSSRDRNGGSNASNRHRQGFRRG